MSASSPPLGALTAREFLSGYWQKRPLLIRQALPDTEPPLSPEALAGLACEPGVEARIVIEDRTAGAWELRHGPFDETHFSDLPPTHWTLLVQDVDKYVPEVAALRERFRFVPDWRIDDVMISYAAPGGNVGPHYDAYDVFLIQVQGHRRWAIGVQPSSSSDLIADAELKLLRDFHPVREWTLAPGDILYLPPGVSHHGVAEDECMTLSVGFRAPAHRDLIAALVEDLAERVPATLRYGDPDLTPAERPGEIPPEVITRIERVLRSHLQPDRDWIARWFGRFVTEPKPNLGAEPPDHALDATALDAALRRGARITPAPTCRLAWMDRGDGGAVLFCDGEAFDLEPAMATLAPQLCDTPPLSDADLPEPRSLVLATLADLHERGWVVIDGE